MIYKIEIESSYFNDNLFDNGKRRLLYQLINLSQDWYYQSLEDKTHVFHFVKDIEAIKEILDSNGISYEIITL